MNATLTVWCGSMPETNGKSNFTAILNRKDAEGLDKFGGFTIARSEYPERVRYEADYVRYLIGELDKEPWILDYDTDKHSGYVAPVKSPWTAIHDGLPPPETPVLIMLGTVPTVGELRWEHPGHEDTFKSFLYWDNPQDDGQGWEWDDITHWMYLPPIPEPQPQHQPKENQMDDLTPVSHLNAAMPADPLTEFQPQGITALKERIATAPVLCTLADVAEWLGTFQDPLDASRKSEVHQQAARVLRRDMEARTAATRPYIPGSFVE